MKSKSRPKVTDRVVCSTGFIYDYTFILKVYIGFLLLLLYVMTMLTKASACSVRLCIRNIDEPPWIASKLCCRNIRQ